MAEDAVDAAVAGLPGRAGLAHGPPAAGRRARDWDDRPRRRAAARRRRAGCRRRPSSGCCTGTATGSATSSSWPATDPALARPLTGAPGLPGRRGGARGHRRGRAAPGRRADPAHPDLDRDRAPRRGVRARGRRADGAACSAGTTSAPAREVAHYRPGWRRSGSRSGCPTTRPRTRPGWARPTSAARRLTGAALSGGPLERRHSANRGRPVTFSHDVAAQQRASGSTRGAAAP